jgi:hypothetical protein
MASLHDLRRAIFPTARPLGSTDPSPERGEQPVQWVRVLRSRVPAFESLDAGDLVVIPGPALAIVAPDTPRIDELADVLARAGLPAVLLVEGDAGSESLATLGAKVADAGVTAFWMERTDPAALERRIIRALIDGTRLGESTIELAAEDLTQPAYRPAVDRILRAVMDAPEGPYSARELLAPILVGRVQARQERIATLRAVLESERPRDYLEHAGARHLRPVRLPRRCAAPVPGQADLQEAAADDRRATSRSTRPSSTRSRTA